LIFFPLAHSLHQTAVDFKGKLAMTLLICSSATFFRVRQPYVRTWYFYVYVVQYAAFDAT